MLTLAKNPINYVEFSREIGVAEGTASGEPNVFHVIQAVENHAAAINTMVDITNEPHINYDRLQGLWRWQADIEFSDKE